MHWTVWDNKILPVRPTGSDYRMVGYKSSALLIHVGVDHNCGNRCEYQCPYNIKYPIDRGLKYGDLLYTHPPSAPLLQLLHTLRQVLGTFILEIGCIVNGNLCLFRRSPPPASYTAVSNSMYIAEWMFLMKLHVQYQLSPRVYDTNNSPHQRVVDCLRQVILRKTNQ